MVAGIALVAGIADELVLRRLDRPSDAPDRHLAALRIAVELQARALTGLAAIDEATGNAAQAATLRHHAVGLYTQLGLPAAATP